MIYIDKRKTEQNVIYLIFFSFYFFSYKINFFVMLLVSLILLIRNKFKIQKKMFALLLPNILLLIIGLINSMNNQNYYIQHDIFYFANPIIILMTGFMLTKKINDVETVTKIIINIAIIISLIHIGKFIYKPSVLGDYNSIREYGGLDSYIEVIAISLIFNSKNLYNKILKRIIIFILLCSIISYLSRVVFGVSIILVFFLIFNRSKKKFKSLIFLLTTLIILGSFSIFLTGMKESPVFVFYNKIANSINEISPSDYSDIAEINKNWRGYEAYRTKEMFENGTITKKLFGYGLGSLVDLGINIDLNGQVYDEVVITHNGYYMILIKTGLFGLLMFFLFLYRFNDFLKEVEHVQYNAFVKIIRALLVSITFLTLVVTGIYSQTGCFEILFTASLLSSVLFGIHNKMNISFHQISDLGETEHLSHASRAPISLKRTPNSVSDSCSRL